MMGKFFVMIRDLWIDIFSTLEAVQFEINGMIVSLPALLFAFMVTGIVISVFWKGART